MANDGGSSEGGDIGIGATDAGCGGDSNIGSLRDNAESNTELGSLNKEGFESDAEIHLHSNGELEFDADIDSNSENNLELDAELNSTVENGTAINSESTATDLEDDANYEFSNSSEINFRNTANTPEELEIIQNMRENGEFDELQESSNEPKEVTFNLPSEKTGTFEGEPGNSAFRPNNEAALRKMAEYGKGTVEYKNNKVDFSPFTEHEIEPGLKVDAEVKIGHMTGDRQNPSFEYGIRGYGNGHDADKDLGNYNQADNALAEKLNEMANESNEKSGTNFKAIYTGKDIENYRNVNNLTWHEKEDAETMQLVPTVIHDACRHTGGTAVSKNLQEYGSMSTDEFESVNNNEETKTTSEALVNESDEAFDEFAENEEFDNTEEAEISETEKNESDEEFDEFAEKAESYEYGKNNTEVNGLEYNVEQREIDDPQARDSFESYRTAVTTEELEIYRIMDDRSNPNGSYWTTEKPIDRMNAKIDLALPPTWENENGTHTIGNQRTTYEKAVLPAGKEIYIGTAAPQKTSDGTELSGGGTQIYLENGMPDEYITEKDIPLTFHTNYKEFNEKAEKIEKESTVNSNEVDDNK